MKTICMILSMRQLSLVDVSPEGKVVPGATFGAPPFGDAGKDAPDFSGVISADGESCVLVEY